jgi:hypothetical protein
MHRADKHTSTPDAELIARSLTATSRCQALRGTTVVSLGAILGASTAMAAPSAMNPDIVVAARRVTEALEAHLKTLRTIENAIA